MEVEAKFKRPCVNDGTVARHQADAGAGLSGRYDAAEEKRAGTCDRDRLTENISHDLHVRLPSRSMNCKPLERLQGAASSITSSHPHFGRRGLDPSHVYQVNASSNVHFGS
jgi:hypothetical protein